MTPLTFDPPTAREVIGDAQACRIEAQARQDAKDYKFQPPPIEGDTYWSQVLCQMERLVYVKQHASTRARRERMG
jgi:hypothetical protein